MFFFFQAEDGIRDLVRSRGLGDVYKRQRGDPAPREGIGSVVKLNKIRGAVFMLESVSPFAAVSYTHLTLPTSDLV